MVIELENIKSILSQLNLNLISRESAEAWAILHQDAHDIGELIFIEKKE